MIRRFGVKFIQANQQPNDTAFSAEGHGFKSHLVPSTCSSGVEHRIVRFADNGRLSEWSKEVDLRPTVLYTREFESRICHTVPLAQLVRARFLYFANMHMGVQFPQVKPRSPVRTWHGTFFFDFLHRQRVRVVKEADLKSVGLCPRRFKSCRCRFLKDFNQAEVAQLGERQTEDLKVVGSIPARETKIILDS